MDRQLKDYLKDLQLINEVASNRTNAINLKHLNDYKEMLYQDINITMGFILASIEMQSINDKEYIERKKAQLEEDSKKWYVIDENDILIKKFHTQDDAFNFSNEYLDTENKLAMVVHKKAYEKIHQDDEIDFDIFGDVDIFGSEEEKADKIVNELFDEISNNKHKDNNNNEGDWNGYSNETKK